MATLIMGHSFLESQKRLNFRTIEWYWDFGIKYLGGGWRRTRCILHYVIGHGAVTVEDKKLWFGWEMYLSSSCIWTLSKLVLWEDYGNWKTRIVVGSRKLSSRYFEFEDSFHFQVTLSAVCGLYVVSQISGPADLPSLPLWVGSPL